MKPIVRITHDGIALYLSSNLLDKGLVVKAFSLDGKRGCGCVICSQGFYDFTAFSSTEILRLAELSGVLDTVRKAGV